VFRQIWSTTSGKVGTVLGSIGTIWQFGKWVLDWTGRAQLMKDALPYALRFIGWTWAPAFVFLAGAGLVLLANYERKTLTIHYAGYGLGEGRYKDVTLTVKGHIQDEREINMPVENTTFHDDPYEGKDKHLLVRYSFGLGIPKETVVLEHYHLILPIGSGVKPL
jgi:hypothetical protein